MKKCFLAAFFFIFFPVINTGASVAVHVIETGLPEGRAVNQHTEQWENAFMDVLFESGFIVSNAPILRIETKPAGDIFQTLLYGSAEMKNWGLDFILVIQLDYSADPRFPSEISFIIYKVSTGERIHEARVEGRLYGSTRDEYNSIRTIAGGLVPYLR